MKTEEIPMIMTTKEMAKILKIGLNSAYTLVRSDQLEVLKIGRQIRITRAALLRYLEVQGH